MLADEEFMVLRLVIDPFRHMMVGGIAPIDLGRKLLDQPTMLNIRVNRFIPADFVFRCKVVQYG